MSKINKKQAVTGVVITIPVATLVTGGGVIIKEYTQMKTQIARMETKIDNLSNLVPKYENAVKRLHETDINVIKTEMRIGEKIHNLENQWANLYNRRKDLL